MGKWEEQTLRKYLGSMARLLVTTSPGENGKTFSSQTLGDSSLGFSYPEQRDPEQANCDCSLIRMWVGKHTVLEDHGKKRCIQGIPAHQAMGP